MGQIARCALSPPACLPQLAGCIFCYPAKTLCEHYVVFALPLRLKDPSMKGTLRGELAGMLLQHDSESLRRTPSLLAWAWRVRS